MSEFEPISIDPTPTAPLLAVVPEPAAPEPLPHGCPACDAEGPSPMQMAEDGLRIVADCVHAQVAALHSTTDGSVTHVPTEAGLLTISMNLIDITSVLSNINETLQASEAARQAERADMEAKLERLITQGLALIATPTVTVHPGPAPKARKPPAKAVRRKSSTGKRAR